MSHCPKRESGERPVVGLVGEPQGMDGGYGFGRYYAALSMLDEDDEPSRPVRQEYVDWSGSTGLAPLS
ncbi:hypothetical protein O7627_18680 [Solwaraspora sp. WMMD1047]|uniref:hypothetical protein n=1 Tax=Solwaraspora sp. WMMD1047 TaxID=3016102 RepID=UPI002417D1CA|nr:hypothetical protein [Solwaraspora sp. WMMD1047]MDG4831326.1 hypothetical protein [Solwaraspora sp. WMMD1047]